ncbi:unnamed protein product [Hermetia illucens]|uniref:G2/mitotic-specific cyclin-B3 n=1 Tax=Hermetia illucens TaxID=343691 RepID=A0A7R8Z213_HERIL|nr:G2/mitotic-specific cyclin-B3 isoform X2 [Hermetia illucens]CAD7090302.1 unnamed protein product [Hermetia illucens]
MAPSKYVRGAAATTKSTLLPLARKGISTRSQNIQDQNVAPVTNRGKRKADNSPLKNDKVKRSALGNLTNNVIQIHVDDKKNVLAKSDNVSKKTAHIHTTKNDAIKPQSHLHDSTATNKILTRAAAKNATNQILPPPLPLPSQAKVVAAAATSTTDVPTVTVTKNKDPVETSSKPATRRISNEFEKTEESLYMSALEDITSCESIRFSGNFESRRSLRRSSDLATRDTQPTKSEDIVTSSDRIATPSPLKKPPRVVPEGVVDFDKDFWNDPFQVSHYAMDIFEYLKQRETMFPIRDYMDDQVHLSKWMRSLLVDWMVEVQETFELNHETLYLGVKLVDTYLMQTVVSKDKLQLLGATALFIACKYDERTPPLVEDFLYICDGAYTHNEIIKTEKDLLRTVNFDLSIPLSYRFLRRYARCAKIQMQTLTLARYILEMSLMDYSVITLRDSHLASAALFMALRMTGVDNPWDKTLEYYSGYKLEDFAFIVPMLNNFLQRKPREAIKTIRNKYSHKIFFEVTKVPLLSLEKLFENTGMIEKTTAV